jgi:hypothetical protein
MKELLDEWQTNTSGNGEESEVLPLNIGQTGPVDVDL